MDNARDNIQFVGEGDDLCCYWKVMLVVLLVVGVKLMCCPARPNLEKSMYMNRFPITNPCKTQPPRPWSTHSAEALGGGVALNAKAIPLYWQTALTWSVVCAQLGQNSGGCGCGVSVVLYTSCRVQHTDNTQTLWNWGYSAGVNSW